MSEPVKIGDSLNIVRTKKSDLDLKKENELLKLQLAKCKEQRNYFIEKLHGYFDDDWRRDQYKCDRELELIKLNPSP